jgi:predicted nucleic acid-binding protein
MTPETFTSLTLGVDQQDDLREAARKLCYFAAEGSQSYVNDLLEHLVKHGLADLPPGTRRPQEIHERIRTFARVQLEYEQVLSALGRLVEKKVVTIIDADSPATARFILPIETISALKGELRSQRDFERQVLQTWLQEVKARHPGLTNDDADALIADLTRFATRLYSLHSIESLALYYGEDEKISSLIAQVSANDLRDVLPERPPALHEIRLFELPRFFRDMPLDRKQYIAKQLNPTFLLHMLQLDPSCAKLASSQIKGGTIFLDTNFLYRLFGFDGLELQHAAKRLLELSRGLGYQPVISPRTVAEYRRSIEQFKRRASTMPDIQPEIAEAALLAALEEDSNTQYWRSVRDRNGRYSPEVHYELHRRLEPFLEQYGIRVDDQYEAFFQAHDDLVAREESVLRQALPGWQPRHDGIVSHDAYHRLLILALRKEEDPDGPLETPYWFLTCDTKLVVYDRVARARTKLKTPYCVLTSHWMQLLSPFCAAVEGFEIVQAETLDSPLFRLFPSPSPEMLQDIITRMTMTEHVPPSAVAAMIANQAFLRAFAQAPDDAKREEIIQDFYSQYIAGLEHSQRTLQEEVEQRSAELRAVISDKEALAQRVEVLSADQAALKAQAHQTEQLLSASQAEKGTLTAQLQQMTGELQGVSAQARTAEERYQAEMTSLRQETALERERSSQLLAKLEADQRQQEQRLGRQRKLTLVSLVWIGAALLLIGLRPWEWPGDLAWLTLTILVVAATLTQAVALNFWTMPRAMAAALILIDVVAITIAGLLPLGVPVPESWGILVGAANILGGFFGALALLKLSQT